MKIKESGISSTSWRTSAFTNASFVRLASSMLQKSIILRISKLLSVQWILSSLTTPPKPLQSLIAGFQITSFGATKIHDHASEGCNFGQVYHKIGSMPNDGLKFLQIYFKDSCEECVTTQCQYNFIERAEEREQLLWTCWKNFWRFETSLFNCLKQLIF